MTVINTLPQDGWNLIFKNNFPNSPTDYCEQFFTISYKVMLVSKQMFEIQKKYLLSDTNLDHIVRWFEKLNENDPFGSRIKSFLIFFGSKISAIKCNGISLNVLQIIKENSPTLKSLNVFLDPNCNTKIFKEIADLNSLESLEINILFIRKEFYDHKKYQRRESTYYQNEPTSDDLMQICKLDSLKKLSCNRIKVTSPGHLLKIATLTKLEQLALGLFFPKSMRIKDEVIQALSSLKKLQSLSITFPTHSTQDANIYVAVSKMPELKVLKINVPLFNQNIGNSEREYILYNFNCSVVNKHEYLPYKDYVMDYPNHYSYEKIEKG